MSNLVGNVFDIVRNSFVDGPGMRTVVFFKGCNLNCQWCHNPEGKSFDRQLLFYKDKCANCGICKKVCPYGLSDCDYCGKCEFYCVNGARKIAGKKYGVDELFLEIEKDCNLYKETNGGVTFSGGECMLQIDFLEAMLKKCQASKIHTAVDTAGNVSWEYFERIIPYTDLFLYDVKCIAESLHMHYTDVSNKKILDNLIQLSSIVRDKIFIRIPVINEFNGNMNEMQKIAKFLRELKLDKVELLPY